jgi:hypothetical protein
MPAKPAAEPDKNLRLSISIDAKLLESLEARHAML